MFRYVTFGYEMPPADCQIDGGFAYTHSFLFWDKFFLMLKRNILPLCNSLLYLFLWVRIASLKFLSRFFVNSPISPSLDRFQSLSTVRFLIVTA